MRRCIHLPGAGAARVCPPAHPFNLPCHLPPGPPRLFRYTFTGIVGCLATIVAAVALHRGRSLNPAFWLFILSITSVRLV